MNVEDVRAAKFAPVPQTYTTRDTILYALSVGFASKPRDPAHLNFLQEDGLQAVPTMANVLGYPGLWMADARFGLGWQRILQAEHRLALHAPLPASGTIVGQNAVIALEDRGERGAMLHQRNDITEQGTGRHLASSTMSILFQQDGGCGNWGTPPEKLAPLPDRAPDSEATVASWEAQPLLYRLSGDLHPLHVNPAVAQAMGFERPILHGLATMGMAGYAVLRDYADMAPDRLRALDVRFSAPVLPGDILRIAFWDEGGGLIRFCATVPERDGVKVLDRGTARLTLTP